MGTDERFSFEDYLGLDESLPLTVIQRDEIESKLRIR
jgi:hypothetical protein